MDIRANDGYVLRATRYDGGDRAIVIAGAMGVARRFYDAFVAAARSSASRRTRACSISSCS